MYKPSIHFERTPHEYKDPELSWNRDDTAFFASGACHILAYAFRYLYPEKNCQIVHIKPIHHDKGHHIYIKCGAWAFDFNGWTEEQELLAISQEACAEKYPGWDYEQVGVTDDLETFCSNNRHRLPADFPHSPWERAFAFIKKLNS